MIRFKAVKKLKNGRMFETQFRFQAKANGVNQFLECSGENDKQSFGM